MRSRVEILDHLDGREVATPPASANGLTSRLRAVPASLRTYPEWNAAALHAVDAVIDLLRSSLLACRGDRHSSGLVVAALAARSTMSCGLYLSPLIFLTDETRG